jgi:hypothetical protein
VACSATSLVGLVASMIQAILPAPKRSSFLAQIRATVMEIRLALQFDSTGFLRDIQCTVGAFNALRTGGQSTDHNASLGSDI